MRSETLDCFLGATLPNSAGDDEHLSVPNPATPDMFFLTSYVTKDRSDRSSLPCKRSEYPNGSGIAQSYQVS
jgi:hypothetical protein